MLEPQNLKGLDIVVNKGNDQKAGIVDHKRVDRSRVTNHHNRDSLWCTYSQKATHTQEQRWKLHGEPSTSNHDKRQAHLYFIQPIKERSLEQGGFNQEEIEKLQTLLGSFEKLLGTCSLELLGKFLTSIELKVLAETFINSWVIDSDGTDHITHSSRKFNNYNPCPNNRKIVIDDGSLTTIIGIGDVQISLPLTLRNVLHVPKLFTNLVSIQNLT